MVLSIRSQIVGPFVAVVALVGAVGTFDILSDLARTTTAQVDGSLLRAANRDNDQLAILETERVSLLRAASDTQDVPQALAAKNATQLSSLLGPLLENAAPARLQLRVLDGAGAQVLGLQGNGAALPTALSGGPDLRGQPAIRAVLSGTIDQFGDKYVFQALDASSAPVLYWAGPVKQNGHVVGAVVIGEPLAALAATVRGSGSAATMFYDPAGRLLTSTMAGVPSLGPGQAQSVSSDHPLRLTEAVAGQDRAVLIWPWTMRGRPVGYVGTMIDTAEIEAAMSDVRLLLTALFIALALLVILVGYLIATYITRRVQVLAASMKAVAAGDLARRAPAAGGDEVGTATMAFNTMAASLQQKSTELEKTYFGTLEALARAIDARDPYTFEHSSRVARLTMAIADGMELTPEQRLNLRRSALMHDVGKIGVPDSILTKPGPLTDDEWVAIRRHPSIGYDMLKDVPFLKASLDGVLQHHERWEGTGYPAGLKADAISLQARIVAVADTLDAMTSDRAYRKGYSIDFAMQAIRTGSGTQFDPDVVRALERQRVAVNDLLTQMGKTPVSRSDATRLEREAA